VPVIIGLLRDRDPHVLSRAWGRPFHAEHQGQQATFTFDGKLLAGSLQSRTALRLIEEWATAHRQELEANWARVKAGQPLERIAPLD
jgi:hypothetical protein